MSTLPGHAGSPGFLLSQTGARCAELFAQRLGEIGVTPRTYGVLSILVSAGARSQQQLADALGMHRNNMVGLIDELETERLVTRERNAADRRAFDVRATPAGEDVVARVEAMLPELDRAVAGDLDRGEVRALTDLLTRVAEGLGLTPGVHPHLRPRGRRGATR